MSCTWQNAARLAAVAVDLERLAGERALDEARDHHPVLAALPRADRVEEARDHAVEPALLVVAEREELVHRLRVGVQPALLGRRPVDAPVVLAQRLLGAVVAVDLRARRDQHALAEAAAAVEHGLRALHVRDHRVDGLLDDQAHADGGRQVVDDVALVDELVDDRRREHRVDDEVVVGPVAQVLDVLAASPVETSSSAYTSQPSVEQQLGEVRADEAGAACHKGPGHVPQSVPRRLGPLALQLGQRLVEPRLPRVDPLRGEQLAPGGGRRPARA